MAARCGTWSCSSAAPPTRRSTCVEQMAATRGFSGGAAGSYAVADQNEAWVIEVLGGHHWVAARVPDDAFYAQPNMLRIRQVDLSEPGKFRGSADLEQFAISVGRYDPADGPFDVAWAYGKRAESSGPVQHQPPVGRHPQGRAVARPGRVHAVRGCGPSSSSRTTR